MLSLTLVFCAASCLHVVLLYVWLNASLFWFRFSFAAGSSVIVSGLMALTDPDLAVNLAELWAYKPASQESMSTNFISGAVEPMAVPDDFPVTLPHVDESSDEDITLAALAMPLSGVAQTERSVGTAQSESGGACLDGASHDSVPEQLPPQGAGRGSPKCRRLRYKQPVPPGLFEDRALPSASVPPASVTCVGTYSRPSATMFGPQVPDCCVAEQFKSSQHFAQMGRRKKYDYVYERVRTYWSKHLVHSCRQLLPDGLLEQDLSTRASRMALRRAFGALPRVVRREAAIAWVSGALVPQYMRTVALEFFQCKDSEHKPMRGTTFLMTFIGPWTHDTSQSDVSAASLPPLAEEVRRLREDAQVVTLWKRVREHARTCQLRLGAVDFAVCLEVCPETYSSVGSLQLHVHLCLRCAKVCALGRTMEYVFDGAVPNVSHTIGGMAANRSTGSWSGFFYCVVEKHGHLFHHSTRRPFKDFLVNASWIMNLLQSTKISLSCARALIITSCNGATRLLKELEVLEQEAERIETERRIADAHAALSPSLKMWKTFPEVQTWLQQYCAYAHRYKCLVLQGPSKLGKTVFARTLAPPGTEVLELNCAAGTEPDLRAYRLTRHGLILFDEISAPVVCKQRKLFQACAAPVQLGCSATNCHSYSVFVHKVRMVLASNVWHSSKKTLSQDDQGWLDANTVVLDIDAPMWLVEEAVAAG